MSYRVLKHGEIIPSEQRDKVSSRYKKITKAVNVEFRGISSETANSLYVGSYGRGTAIDTSDIDVMVILPETEYNRYDSLKGNGQSRLLQAVKGAIQTAYPTSDIHADGQVVVINFTDGIKFEVLPAFEHHDVWGRYDGTYTYPDANMGGNWKSTNPKEEQDAIRRKNEQSNGLLFDTCKHFRRVRDDHYSSYHLSGIVIDTFIYRAIGYWHWTEPSEQQVSKVGDYESALADAFNRVSSYNPYLYAPGSGDVVSLVSSYECLKKVINYICY